jgi:Rv2525c-like, glycoside hydrolase-like domain
MSSDLATAEQQGRAEAATAVASAQSLGIGRGSTLYYDLEDYDIAPDDCRRAALNFISGWTEALDQAGYDSGVYSNIAAAITSLDLADRLSSGSYSMPDDIWFAWENGRADTATDERVQVTGGTTTLAFTSTASTSRRPTAVTP